MDGNDEQPIVHGQVEEFSEYVAGVFGPFKGLRRVLDLRVRDLKNNDWKDVVLHGGIQGIHGFVRDEDIVKVYGEEQRSGDRKGTIRAGRIFVEQANSTVCPNTLGDEPNGWSDEPLARGEVEKFGEKEWRSIHTETAPPRTRLTFRVRTYDAAAATSILRAVEMECKNKPKRIRNNDEVEVYGREDGYGNIRAKRVVNISTGTEISC